MKKRLKSGTERVGLGVIPMGFWRWPLTLCLAVIGVFGVYHVKGGPIHYYRAEAILKTANVSALTHDVEAFRSNEFLRESASALGWIKPQPSAAQLEGALAKLRSVLVFEADAHERVHVNGLGKDPAGIVWVVNTVAKTTVACSAHTASPTPWHLVLAAQPAVKPWKTEGFKPLVFGGVLGAFLGLILFGNRRVRKTKESAAAPMPSETLLTHIQKASEPIAVNDPIVAPAPPISLEVIEPKPLAPVVVPVDKPSLTAKAREPMSAESVYQEWLHHIASLYAPTVAIANGWATAVDDLMKRTTTWAATSPDPLLRYLAARTAEETVIGHVLHVVLLTSVWCLQEGLPEDDMRLLMWTALVHDLGLKAQSAHDLLRFPIDRCCDSINSLPSLTGLEESQKTSLAMILSKLGGQRGMQPAITPDEEKAEQLARMFSRLDRKEKILRRGALQLAKRRSLQKAV